MVYGELYGGNIQRGRKIYGGDDVDFRAFAMKSFMSLNELMAQPASEIANLREGWTLGETGFKPFTDHMAHAPFDSVPLIKIVDGGDIQLTPMGTYEWLKAILGNKTHAAIGEGGTGRPEGGSFSIASEMKARRFSRLILKTMRKSYEKGMSCDALVWEFVKILFSLLIGVCKTFYMCYNGCCIKDRWCSG